LSWTRSGFSAVRGQTDAMGSACLLMPHAGSGEAHVLGRLGDALVWAHGATAVSAQPATCDASCEATVLEGLPFSLGCVRGTLEMPWRPTATTSIRAVGHEVEWTTAIRTGEEFCVDARLGTELTLGRAPESCGDGSVVVTAPPVAGADCGAPAGCTDLGTIMCCRETEFCDNAADDDCDGTVDEGCVCGAQECGVDERDRCCASSAALTLSCGERSALTGECVGIEDLSIPIGCPNVTVPIEGGDTETAVGCCRSVGQCGLMWRSFGCVAAEDVPRVWGPATTLPITACTQ